MSNGADNQVDDNIRLAAAALRRGWLIEGRGRRRYASLSEALEVEVITGLDLVWVPAGWKPEVIERELEPPMVTFLAKGWRLSEAQWTYAPVEPLVVVGILGALAALGALESWAERMYLVATTTTRGPERDAVERKFGYPYTPQEGA